MVALAARRLDEIRQSERIELLKGEILPQVNQFAYGQVESPYGSGQFIKDLREAFDGIENVALSEISNKDAIYNSIKDFLGKGS